jgi:hypothetical protein
VNAANNPTTPFGIWNLFHVIPPVDTNPNSPGGTHTGLGGLQLYNLSTVKLHRTTYGAGPLVVLPTESVRERHRRDHAGDDIPTFYPLQLPPWTVSSKHGSAGFNSGSGVKAIPVGLGFGKVWNFADGKTINFYMESQYSVWRSGVGAPDWQLFTGINFQFPVHFQIWSRETRH